MKKNYWLMVSMLLGLLCACSEDSVLIPEVDQPTGVTTRALSSNVPSSSNPNLHDNWENVVDIVLNGGGGINAPWVVASGNSMNIPLDFRTDIKKEDGWRMLSHTLLDKGSLEPNYILLYNPMRGILKGFYYSRENNPNNSFMWVMESSRPTSVFPSNTLVQGNINSSNQYVTTSNVVKTSKFVFSQLNQGWNAFSFELPYSPSNNNPIIDIFGYNQLQANLAMGGNYSGEVVIPLPVTEKGALESIVGAVGDLFGGSSKIFEKFGILKKLDGAVGMLGATLGITSLYKSKKSIQTVRATSSGKINLTGNLIANLGGAVTSINDIDLKKLNLNEELGLWSIIQEPTIQYERYSSTMPYGNDSYLGTVNIVNNDILSQVIINPQIKKQIRSYRVANTQFFYEKPGTYLADQVTNDCYLTYLRLEKRLNEVINYDPKNIYMHYMFMPFPKDVRINVTLEFVYNDGSSFLSSKSFKANFKEIDNTDKIKKFQQNGAVIIWL